MPNLPPPPVPIPPSIKPPKSIYSPATQAFPALSIEPAHNMTTMPSNPDDCPCAECQDHIARELLLDRESIWPWKSAFRIEASDELSTIPCPCCNYPIEALADYDPKKKQAIRKSVVHVLLSLLVRRNWGTGSFLDVQKIHIHPGCDDKLHHLPDFVPERAKIQIARLAKTLPGGKDG